MIISKHKMRAEQKYLALVLHKMKNNSFYVEIRDTKKLANPMPL